MKRKWKIAAVTTLAVGMLGTAAIAAPQNWTEVKALFNHKMQVSVNGQAPDEALTPLMVDGVAYLPVRELASVLDHEVSWVENEYRIDIQKIDQNEVEKEEEKEQAYETAKAVVLAVSEGQDGGKTVDIAPTETSPMAIIRLHVSKEIVESLSGELAPGIMVNATYSKAMTRSIPPQSVAQAIEILHEISEVEGTVASVNQVNDTLMAWVTDTPEEQGSGIVLNIGKESRILSPNGEKLDLADIKQGSKIKAYYGPQATLSLPPQSFAHVVFVLE